MSPKRPTVSSLDSKKLNYIMHMISNKIFEIGGIPKIIADFSITQYLIANRKLIYD